MHGREADDRRDGQDHRQAEDGDRRRADDDDGGRCPQGAGALVNVLLNYLLIPEFGGQGAAYATLISYAFASFFSLLIFSKTRPIFIMMLKSIFSIFRYSNFKALE